ncbi:transporter substrate-binding domain-containing protein [uncultured Ruminococcus sp.]|uniref:transporter substrate-binding domain-containing protein n=1 Tax=uncultured Ruminococcus sp. TaxID=165186 RepID=UPI0025D9AC84|nr:transporter substrate-binding domain-containing protein [uncultured Ruminococcus sp.]
MRSRFLRTVCTALTASVMALTFAGCGSSSGDAKQSSGGDGKVLRVGMECAYAPFNWTQIGEEVPDGSKAVPIYGTSEYAYGYDVMVAQKLADDLGMSLEIHKVEWDSIGLSLDAKEYDCIIAGMGRTKEREASYSFTEPYYYRDNCLVVKKGSDYESVKGLSDFKGKNVTVTTQLGTGWVPLLDQIPDATLGANYETTAEVFMAVSNGVADVALIDLPTAESALLTNTDLTIVVPDESDAFEGDKEMTNVCIATRKDDTELRDKLQKAMDDIGWSDKAKMDELMSKAVELQPAAN